MEFTNEEYLWISVFAYVFPLLVIVCFTFWAARQDENFKKKPLLIVAFIPIVNLIGANYILTVLNGLLDMKAKNRTL